MEATTLETKTGRKARTSRDEPLKSITIAGRTFLTAIGMGEVLHITPQAVMDLARKGAIPSYQFPHRKVSYFDEEDVLQALLDGRRETKREMEERIEETGYARVIPRKREFKPRPHLWGSRRKDSGDGTND